MGFLTPNSSTQNKERLLLLDLWKLLKGDENEYVTQNNLCRCLHAILGFYSEFEGGDQSPSKEELKFENDDGGIKEEEMKTFIKDDMWSVTAEDARKIGKHFNLLYINRIHSLGVISQMNKEERVKKMVGDSSGKCTF